MRNFRTLDIWVDSMNLAEKEYLLAEKLPGSERFNLYSQITRCAVSIPSNIAEGCSRKSQLDFARFLEISLGSSFELETQLLLIFRLKLLTGEFDIDSLFKSLSTLQRRINSLITKIKG
ncbi:MAG: four helix bundle protein [Imperialibacter sp.]|uniref:four helix bundle protein n=1 Tax=Imperialibacter sp. TaxID=2038411 RepID=UPI0032EE52B7